MRASSCSSSSTSSLLGTLASPSTLHAAAHVAAAADNAKQQQKAKQNQTVALWQTALRKFPAAASNRVPMSPHPPLGLARMSTPTALRQGSSSSSAFSSAVVVTAAAAAPVPAAAGGAGKGSGNKNTSRKKEHDGGGGGRGGGGKKRRVTANNESAAAPADLQLLASQLSNQVQQLQNLISERKNPVEVMVGTLPLPTATKKRKRLSFADEEEEEEEEKKEEEEEGRTTAVQEDDDVPLLWNVREAVLGTAPQKDLQTVTRNDILDLVKLVQRQYMTSSLDSLYDTFGDGSCPSHTSILVRLLTQLRSVWNEPSHATFLVPASQACRALQWVVRNWDGLSSKLVHGSKAAAGPVASPAPTLPTTPSSPCLLYRAISAAASRLEQRCSVGSHHHNGAKKATLTRADVYAMLDEAASLSFDKEVSAAEQQEEAEEREALLAAASGCCRASAFLRTQQQQEGGGGCCGGRVWLRAAQEVLQTVWDTSDSKRAVSQFDMFQILSLVQQQSEKLGHGPGSGSVANDLWERLPRLLRVVQQQPQRVLVAVTEDNSGAGGLMGGFCVIATASSVAQQQQHNKPSPSSPPLQQLTPSAALKPIPSPLPQPFQISDIILECLMWDTTTSDRGSGAMCPLLLIEHAAGLAYSRLIKRTEKEMVDDPELKSKLTNNNTKMRVVVRAPSLWMCNPPAELVSMLEESHFALYGEDAQISLLTAAALAEASLPASPTSPSSSSAAAAAVVSWYRYEIAHKPLKAQESRWIRVVPSWQTPETSASSTGVKFHLTE